MKTDQIFQKCELRCKSVGFSRAVKSAEKLFSCTFYKWKYVLFIETKCEKQCMCDCVLICSYLQEQSPSSCSSQQTFLIFGILNLNRLVVDAFVTKPGYRLPAYISSIVSFNSDHNKSDQFIVQASAPSPCLQLSPSLFVTKEEKICGKTFLKSSADSCPEFSAL